MSAANLLARLRELGISVRLLEGNLKLTGAEDKLTSALIEELKKNKEEIILFLKENLNKKLRFESLEPQEKKEYYRLSPAQKRLYVLQQMGTETGDRGNVSYNMPNIFQLKGTIDIEKLNNAFRRLIMRHESLRTSFITIDGFPFQRIHEKVKWDSEYSRLPAGESSTAAIRDFIRPFDLTKAPLLRVGILEIEADDYILMVDMHHIISDGISHNILTTDLVGYYTGVSLPPPRIQYKDYAEWLNTDHQQEAIKKKENYWLKQFSGEIPVLSLPADYPRPAFQSFEGDACDFLLPGDQTGALKQLISGLGSTLFIMLLAIFNILLAKLSGQQDIVVGVPVAGRRHADLEKIVGMFINTLALRNYPTEEKDFLEFLKEVRQWTLEAFENQDYPFEDIVEQVYTHRDSSRSPLFDVMFTLQNQATTHADLPGLLLEPFPATNNTAKFDLSLDGMEIGNHLSFTLGYCTKLFKKTTIEKYVTYLKQIIASVLADPGQRLQDIEIISEAEKNEILIHLNDTAVKYAMDTVVIKMIEDQVEKTPDEIAAVFEGRTLNYRELNEKANGLAQQLTAKGIGPGSYVPVAIDHSLELLISFLSIMKTGAAFVPVDVRWPGERIKVVLNDLDQVFILASFDNAGLENEWNREILIIDLDKIPAGHKNPQVTVDKNTPIYVMYTSGSTGNPKGVIVPHRGVTNRLYWMNDYFGATSSKVVLQTTRYIYDSVVWQFFWPLINGGRTIILPPDFIMRADHLTHLIEKHGITLVDFVPSVFSIVVDNMTANPHWQEKLISLKHIIMGGEEIIPSAVYKFMNVFPQVRITNLYGPTETTIGCIYHQVTGDEGDKIPIGKPIANVQVYVMDRYKKLVPNNLPGEIYIAGVGVGLGYLNNIEKTRAVFEKIPFAHHETMYRTGDLGRWSELERIDFFGRIDFQVKIRGVRIEPAEIESKLLKHKYVKEAVVEVKGEGENDKFLCAYIVTRQQTGETSFSISALREFLSGELPPALIPSYFIQMPEIPLTPGGKINRKALPNPLGSADISLKDDVLYIPPSSVVEKIMVETWEKVLGRHHIGINENFFLAGGDSIKAIQVIARLNNAGYKLQMKDLFKYPVISGLAPHVKKQERIPVQSPVVGIIPLTPIQKKFFNNLPVDAHHYNQAVMFHNHEGFDKEAINYVFSRLQEHHDALRMTFQADSEKGEIIQTSHGVDYPLSLDEYDLRNRDNSLTELQVKINQIQAGINLEKGPLMKLGLFHLDDGDRLLIAVHHLVIDGVSWRILFEDIETLYEHFKRGEKADLPLKSDSFATWSKKLKEYADSKKFLKEKSYWARLEENTILPITGDSTTAENEIKDSRDITISLEPEETAYLTTTVNEAFKTEIDDILLTALGLGINKTFGGERILIAMESHGREEILENMDIHRTIGWFTTVYPVVLNFSYAHDTGRQIKVIKEILRGVPSKGIGYGILKYLTGAEHKKEIEFKLNPQISFNYLGQFDADIQQLSFGKIAMESTGHSQSLRNRREYEVDITAMTAGNRLTMTFSYHEKHIQSRVIAALAAHCQAELSHIITFCRAAEKSEPTPADFTYKGLSIENIDRLIQEYPGMEDLYTLTSMQEGMLFHALHDRASYSYFEQTSYRLEGELDIARVEKSLNELFKRHDILRTAFVYKDTERPVQVVLKDRVCDFYYEDISETGPGDEIEKRLKKFKEKDKQRSFDLSKDVLMRVSILRVDKAEYEFTWSFHHILMDGWCVGILNSEFFEIYESLEAGRPYRLPAVKPYRAYIQWLENRDKEASAAYWREHLGSFVEPTGIPKKVVIKQKENEPGHGKRQVSLVLTPEKTVLLNKLAAGRHVTMNTVVQVIWAILLGIYNGREDVVFGSVVSGRPFELEGVESMVGLFINTIPVHIRFVGPMKFHALLEKVQEEAVAGEPYHYHPLADIQAQSPLKQNLIDHIFAFENYPVAERIAGYSNEENKIAKLKLKIAGVDIFEQTNYDFEVISSGSEQLMILFQYNEDIYSRDFVERIPGHMTKILDQIIANDELEIGQLNFLSEQEEKQLLYDFNNTEVDYPRDKTIHQLFEEQVAKMPDRIALIGQVGPFGQVGMIGLTCRELNEQSDHLACLLQDIGVLADDIVGIMMERSIDLISGILAILKAGNAYLPIDVDYPQERIQYMLEDSNAKALLGTEEYRKKIIVNCQLLIVNCKLRNVRSRSLAQAHLHHSSFIIHHSKLAYIMYTSGSTGQPKGVVVTHRNVVRLVKNADFVPLAEETRILQTGAPVFDAATFEIWGSLLNGGRLVLVGKEVILNAHRLSVVLASQRINTLWLSAPLFNQLMQENIELFAPLSYLLVGGDVLSPARINRVRSKFPDLKIINGYGPTENTTFSTTYLIEKEFEHNIPIGRPITNSTAYLYDKSNRLTPIGVVGELYVGGDGVAGGYLNNPELTAEKFSKSNRSYRTNIIYKTGDLARWLEDGNIEYLGRIDRQVKIRGFRIELEEIENKLAGHNEIEQAVVAAKTNENGDTYLCAYIISQKDIQIPRLKEYLAAYLPGYMVPLYFIKLEKMPLTAGGKVDYNALPTPGEISFNENVEYVPPSDDVEKKLAAIWQKVMDRDNIGVKEDFFTLGGDSIRAIQVISRMNSAGYKLEIKDLFKYPTIAELAPQIKKLKRIPDQSPVAGKIPLTPIQVDFFAGNYLEPHHANQAVMFYAKEGFVKETVKKIFTRIQEHHDALRMTYQSDENGGILQTGHGVNYPLSLEEYDLRNRENGLTELQVKINQIQTGIDLEKGPLMKLGLFHLEDGDRLLIVIHHLVIDGISWRILFEDIKTLYKQGTGAVLPLKSDSFAQWSKILREYADSKKFLKEKDYWAQLETITAPDIKMDYEATGNYAEDTWRESFKLGEEETSQLLTAANAAFKTEINDILLTALGLGIKKTFGQERVLIALEGHGREVISEDIDISRTVGWFTSVYPVLLDISYANDTGRQVKEIKEILRKVPGKGIGYGILKYLTQKENKSGMEFKLNPQISFNYLGQFDADVKRNAFFEIAKEYAGDELSPKNKRNFELDVSGMIIDNRLTLNITYNKNHFKPGTISALAGNFEVELRRLIAFCCARENSEPTPADFIYKGLSIETIDRLTKEYPGMEDLYTLTPMQEGMLFHTLADESAHVNLYFEQMSYRLHGELDIAVVEKSLNDLFKRHDILRTAFIHDISPRPVQVVLKDRRCDFYYKDIRDTAGNVEIEAFVSDFKAEDKLRAFDLSKDVLARISVLRTDIAEYELIWSSHHILMDGWCIGILNNEFLEIYKSHIENRPYRLPVVKVYRTYIEWLEKQDKQESQKYWQEYLAFFEEQTGLPRIYKTKKYETGYRYERFSLVLDSDVTKKLNNTAARNRVTLNNTVQTLWAILLGKYTGKEDVVFGGVVSGRPAGLAGVENMIGLFINTIPVRVQFDQTMKFNEAVRNVQEKAVAAELHHYHPLVETQSATPLKQDLLDHIIVFENYPATRLIEGYGVEQNNSPQEIALNLSNVEVFGQTNYDFNIIFNAAEQLEVIFKYNGNVYDSHFVQKIAGHFAQLINQVIQNDESKIGAFTILSQEEKTQLLHDFNVTEQDYPQDKTVPQLFEEQASRTPDHVGLLGDVGHVRPVRQVNITYRQLNEQSDNLAGLLIEKGVLVDGVVGLMVGPSLEMMVGILAILKTGNAYLPLDPEFPQERIDYMLKDSGTSILINEKFFRRSRGAILQKSPPGAANLAYVIYTSGTTGKPKGVLIENKNLVNYVYWFKKAAGLTEQDRTVLTSSYCFDLGYTVVYPSISSGCQLHIIPKESYMSPGDLLTYIVLHRVTFLKMTPSLFAVISASEEFVRLDCRELRLIVLGGEQIKPYDINRTHEIWPHITIMNHYGPTETTIGSIAQVIDFGEFEAYKKKPTIG
ncbi:MAG: hypothetical protein QG657_1578, partial [Acidobacteriota bacterium]|nr:hypothetical protein [Acidobacteriota bacterium]